MNEPSPGQAPPSSAGVLQRLRSGVPVLQWLPAYRLGCLSADAIAGVTLAAYAIPVSLAYATLAGLPPQTGLYCYLWGGLGYALFGSSRHLAIGPTSAISLVFGVTLARLAQGDPGQHAALTVLATLMVAGMYGLAWLLRLSVAANFISESILTGFKAGAALAIAVTQLPRLLGVPGGGDYFFERVGLLVLQLGHVNLTVLAVGLGTVALLLVGNWFLPGRPVAFAVVMIALLVVSVSGLQNHGVTVVGALPAGLPGFHGVWSALGQADLTRLRDLAGLAFACFLLSYIESTVAARTFALRHDYEIDARQELLGLGAANLLAGLGQGYPSAGGLSQSAVNEKAGARTPLALVFASGLVCLVLVLLTGLFHNLPDAVLAAVVLVAVEGLIDIRELRHLWRVSRFDFNAAMVALVGVLVLGILDGVILAVMASLLMLLARATHPHVAFLGRIPGTNRFSDLERHPDNEQIPGVLAFRVESSLFYFNVEHIQRRVMERVQSEGARLRWVVCDLSTSPYVDHAGARMLNKLDDDLAKLGMAFRVVEEHGEVRDVLRAEGLEGKAGHISRRVSLAEVIESLSEPPGSSGPSHPC